MRAITGAIFISFLAVSAFAADLPVPPRRQPPAKMTPPVKALERNEFDKLGGDCIEASNGCQRYVRAGDGKFDATNNIGIACQPKALACTKRK
jgi:hypothetical protein